MLSMLPSFVPVLVLLMCTLHSQSLSYDGSECTNLVEFELSNSSNVASLDGNVATDLSSFPVYISYRCKAALRRYFCLDTYTPKASTSISMCGSVCQQVVDRCEALLQVIAEENSFGLYLYDSFKLCAQERPKSGCANGSADVHFAQDDPKCFYQTVVPDDHGASFPLEPSACAIPCPGQVFHAIYALWHKLFVVFTSISIVCACVTTFTFTKKYFNQRKDRASCSSGIRSLRLATVFPVLMFSVGGLLESSVVCLALLFELFQPTCEGNAKWRSATPMCYVESVALLASGMWSCCWSFVMAFETWSIVFLSLNPLKQQRIRAWHAPVVTAATLTSIIVVHIDIKEVVLVELPFCIASSIQQSSAPLIDAVFWVPGVILVTLSSLMMFMVMFQVRQLERNCERAGVVGQEDQAVPGVSWCAFLRLRPSKVHLLRICLLVLCYNSLCVVIASLVFDQQLHLSKYESHAAAYYSCLLSYSTTDPELGREHCGTVTEWNVSAPLWVWTSYVIMVGCFGLIPFLVFGADYRCDSLVQCCHKSIPAASITPTSKQSTDKPGSPPRTLTHLLVSLPLLQSGPGNPSTPSPSANRSSADSPGVFCLHDPTTAALQAPNIKCDSV